MKKTLIAAAVAAVMAAPLAATADIRVSGAMHVSLDYLHDGEDGAVNTSSNSSNITFSGRSDAGNGLYANWKLQTFLAIDQDVAGPGDGRDLFSDAFAGLGGAFGEVRISHMDTPHKRASRRLDLFGTQVGDSRSIINPTTQYQFRGERFRNAVGYVSPNLNGFQGEIVYSTNTGTDRATNTNDNDGWSGSVSWSQGPLFLIGAATEVSNTGAGDDPRAYTLGGEYKWSDFVFRGLFLRDRNTAGDERDVWGLGASYKVGANTFKAQYYDAGTRNSSDGAYMVAVGVDHSLSKQTTIYTAYAMTRNDDNASYIASGGGHFSALAAAAPGEDPWSFSVGMIHRF